MSRPTVVTTCMVGSSESWLHQQQPYSWHSRAGGGAVHSINSGHVHRTSQCPLSTRSGQSERPPLGGLSEIRLPLQSGCRCLFLPARSKITEQANAAGEERECCRKRRRARNVRSDEVILSKQARLAIGEGCIQVADG